MSKLSEPKNVRSVLPNCCANCIHFIPDPEASREFDLGNVCARNFEPVWGDPMFIYETICDGFKHIKHRKMPEDDKA